MNILGVVFQISSERVCVAFDVEQVVEVEDPKPGYIEVYDYYEKGFKHIASRLG